MASGFAVRAAAGLLASVVASIDHVAVIAADAVTREVVVTPSGSELELPAPLRLGAATFARRRSRPQAPV